MQAHNPSHACALVLVDELTRGGVTDAVLAPGSRSAALAMALHDDPRVRLHVEIDERSAGFLALGLARASGRPVPVVVTSGTAVANLHPAVVEADAGGVPLLLLTADRPPELQHTGANQAIDQVGIFGRAPRWQVVLGVPEDRPDSNALWRATAARALAAARGLDGPPGPVHLDLPFREPTVPASDDGRAPPADPFVNAIDGRPEGRPWVTVERMPRQLEADRVRAIAGRLAATERGLIVVGAGEVPPGPVLALARAAGWPVIAEPTSGVRTGDRLAAEHVVAHAPLLLGHRAVARAHTPDLVLRIGRSGLSPEVAALLGPSVPQVLLDAHGAWLDPDRTVSELLVADVAPACQALADALALPAGSAWSDSWRTLDAAAAAVLDAALDASDAPTEPRTARDLGACLPDGATLVAASSMPVRDLDRFLRPRGGVRIVGNRGASGIDGLVSTTLGTALAASDASVAARPAGPTVGLLGDLAFLHDSTGLLLSADVPAVDATFVVVDNDGGGIFSFLPQADHPGPFERVFGTPHGRDLADLAAFHRLGYREVTTAGELPTAVTGAISAGGLQLVHVRTDRAANLALHRELTAAVHARLDALA